jgi:hypothetical protein
MSSSPGFFNTSVLAGEGLNDGAIDDETADEERTSDEVCAAADLLLLMASEGEGVGVGELLMTWEDEEIMAELPDVSGAEEVDIAEPLATSNEEMGIVELLITSDDDSIAELLTISKENEGIGAKVDDGTDELPDEHPANDKGVGESELVHKLELLTNGDKMAELLEETAVLTVEDGMTELLTMRLLLVLGDIKETACKDRAVLALLEDDTVSHFPYPF